MAAGRQVTRIQLYKPEGGSLGFSVVGLRSEHQGELGIYVQEIQPEGIAGTLLFPSFCYSIMVTCKRASAPASSTEATVSLFLSFCPCAAHPPPPLYSCWGLRWGPSGCDSSGVRNCALRRWLEVVGGWRWLVVGGGWHYKYNQ
jgi:hypothetical protein